MNNKQQVIIPYKGLKDGKHEFNFVLTDVFFQMLDYSEFQKGEVSVDIYLDKKPTHLVFEIELTGKLNVMCDRCLDFFDIESQYTGTLYVKFSGYSESGDETFEELLVLSPGDFEIDLTHYIYESVCLGLPMQRVHPVNSKGKSTCNKTMLKKLNELGRAENESKNITDPRWEMLKNINNN